MSARSTNLNLMEPAWNLVDSVLIPNKCIITLPEMYIVACGYKKKYFVEDVSADSLALHVQNFTSATQKNVVPKFSNRLSWALHSRWE